LTTQRARLVSLGQYIVRSVLRGLVVLWAAFTLVFISLRALPGDAVSANLAPVGASQPQIEAERRALGLDAPWTRQYLRSLGDLAQGDFGESLVSRERVSSVMGGRLGPTFALGMAALAVALLVGSGVGILGALEHPPLAHRLSQSIVMLAQATPAYLTALLALHIFSARLNLLPGVGSGTPAHLILPAAVLGFHSAGPIARVTSAGLRDAFRQPFMLTARSKGLPPIDLLDHGLRVALLPILSVLALQVGFLLSGAVIIEMMFIRRGIGSLLYQSVLSRDYPVVQAIALLSAAIYLLANGLSSLAQRLIDPRLTASLADD
jgi:peptide/nickel transport system permease protein